MLNMPLPCKILKMQSSTAVVDVVSFGDIPKDLHSLNPISIGEVVDFEWGNLSYDDVRTIETAFRTGKANQRFIYEFAFYQMEDGYTVTVQNNKPTIQSSFRRVS